MYNYLKNFKHKKHCRYIKLCQTMQKINYKNKLVKENMFLY